MPLDSTSAAVIGAILGPTAGLIGTKLKDMAEKRDAKRRAQELVKEATDLPLVVNGYWNRASDSDVRLGFLIFSILFRTLAAAVNLICNAFIKPHYEGTKAAATSKGSAGI